MGICLVTEAVLGYLILVAPLRVNWHSVEEDKLEGEVMDLYLSQGHLYHIKQTSQPEFELGKPITTSNNSYESAPTLPRKFNYYMFDFDDTKQPQPRETNILSPSIPLFPQGSHSFLSELALI